MNIGACITVPPLSWQQHRFETTPLCPRATAAATGRNSPAPPGPRQTTETPSSSTC